VSAKASATSKVVKPAPVRANKVAKPSAQPKSRSAQPVPRADPAAIALKEYAVAVGLFRAGEFREAKKRFEHLAEDASHELAYSARLHVRMCDQRIARKEVRPLSAEEHYHYGIALLNEKKLDDARQQFEKALGMTPNADHVHYAYALCLGLKGELSGAHQHLRRAIELQPRNRSIARNDPDFAELCRKPPLNELLSRQ
jgi:tetratricopeptide (TPR) repeat protein